MGEQEVEPSPSSSRPEKKYYVYTPEEIAARRPPYYKAFQLQEAYAQTSWCKTSKNIDKTFLTNKFNNMYKKFSHTEMVKISKKEEKEINVMNIEEAKKAVLVTFNITLNVQELKNLLPPKPSEEELEKMKTKEREKVLVSLERVIDQKFVNMLLNKNAKAVKIQTLFRQYSLRQRCMRRSALKTGK